MHVDVLGSKLEFYIELLEFESSFQVEIGFQPTDQIIRYYVTHHRARA